MNVNIIGISKSSRLYVDRINYEMKIENKIVVENVCIALITINGINKIRRFGITRLILAH